LLREQGASPLTGMKYLWLYGEERLPDRTDAFAALQASHLDVGRAWAIKELLRDL
jgi:transposase